MVSLRDAVRDASQRPEVRAAVHEVYGQLQREIEKRRPICVLSGRCCRFDEFGHRLFVTTMELAAFFGQLEAPRVSDDPAGCPFQSGKICTVHAIRPFGCRVFFCDSTSTDWQQQIYEKFHAQIKILHEEMHVPYLYVEWREALRQMV